MIEQIVLFPVFRQALGLLFRFVALDVFDERVFDVCPLFFDIGYCKCEKTKRYSELGVYYSNYMYTKT